MCSNVTETRGCKEALFHTVFFFEIRSTCNKKICSLQPNMSTICHCYVQKKQTIEIVNNEIDILDYVSKSNQINDVEVENWKHIVLLKCFVNFIIPNITLEAMWRRSKNYFTFFFRRKVCWVAYPLKVVIEITHDDVMNVLHPVRENLNYFSS